MKALLLEYIGAFVRCAIGGFKKEFKSTITPKSEQTKNIIISLIILFILVFISIKGMKSILHK